MVQRVISHIIVNILLLAPCNSYLFAQTSFDIIPNIGGIDGAAQAWSLLADSVDFYVVGNLRDTTQNGNTIIRPWISKINYEGEIKNTQLIHDSIENEPLRISRNFIFENNKNNVLIYGSERVNPGIINPKLVEVNPESGQIVNSIIIQHPEDSLASLTRKLFFTTDTLSIVSSYFWVGNNYHFYITLIDSNYNMVHEFIISDNIYNNVVYYMAPDSDSSIILIGDSRVASDLGNFPAGKPFWMRLSMKGEVLDFRRAEMLIEKAVSFPLAFSFTVQKSNQNNWVFSCVYVVETHECPTCHYLVPYTISMSNDFDSLLWNTKFISLAPQNNSQPLVTSLVKCNDNSGFVTAGFDGYSFLYKVDNNGDSIWLRKFKPLGWTDERAVWTEFVDLKVTPFNTFIAAGRIADGEFGIIRPWVVHIDSVGCIIPGCDKAVGTKNNVTGNEEYFKIYPNPSSDIIYILGEHPNPIKCELLLNNLNGQVVKKVNFQSNLGDQYILSLSELAPGTYILSITDENNKVLKVERIIIQ